MSNSLASVHPELISEWSEKNLPLTPDKITFGSNKRVWWKGACGHEYKHASVLLCRMEARLQRKLIFKTILAVQLPKQYQQEYTGAALQHNKGRKVPNIVKLIVSKGVMIQA